MPQSRRMQLSKFWFVLLILCASRELSAGFVCQPGVPGTPSTNVPPNAPPNASNTTFSVSNTCSEQVTTTNLTQRVDQFTTEVRARLQGGPLLLDQTFAAPFTDPLVKSTLASAQQLLTNQGATGFVGPTLLSNSTLLSGSNTTASFLQTAPPQTFVTFTTTIGGGSVVNMTAIVQTGNIGQCQGFDATGVPFGCDPKAGNPFTVVVGNQNVNGNTHTLYSLGVTNTTTNTFLTSQVYDLTGTTAPVGPASVPEPATLALAGFAIPGLWLGFRLRRRRDAGRKLGEG